MTNEELEEWYELPFYKREGPEMIMRERIGSFLNTPEAISACRKYITQNKLRQKLSEIAQ